MPYLNESSNSRNIKYICVHCTAGSNKDTCKGVFNFHTKKPEKIAKNGGYIQRGWNAPGYHWFVEGDGAIKEMWPENKVSNGIGVGNANSISINVCWAGGLSGDNRTAKQKSALINLISTLKKNYPKAKVVGHRYFGGPKGYKSCPQFDAGKEYGGISTVNGDTSMPGRKIVLGGKSVTVNNTKKKGTDPTKFAGGGYQATTSQIEQYKIAYEAVGKSLEEFPDQVINQINTVYETYKTLVDTVLAMQVKIPIPIPDPMEIINTQLTGYKEAIQEFKEDAIQVVDNLIPVPDGTEIPKGQTIEDLLGKMGIIEVLKDLISPATDFIKDAPAIIDASLANTTKAISGTFQSTVNSFGIITSVANMYDADTPAEDDSTGFLGLLDDGMEFFGNTLQAGTTAITGGIGMVTGATTGALNTGMEVAAGTLALAEGSVGAVMSVVSKIPGAIPKIIASAMAYGMKKAQGAVNDAVGTATDAAGKVIDGAMGAATGGGANSGSKDKDFENEGDMAVIGYIDEPTEPTFAKPKTLSAQVSDDIPNIYKEDLKQAIGEVPDDAFDISTEDSINNDKSPIDNTTNSNTTNSNISDSESNSNSSNSSNSKQSISADGKIDMAAMMASIEAGQKAAEAAVASAVSKASGSSDPHIKDEEKEILEFIESSAKSTQKIAELENQFGTTFTEEIQIKLYGEIRKGMLEILPKVEVGDDNSKNFINMASYAALRITPAVIEYIDEKFKVFEQKINTLLSSMNTGTDSDTSGDNKLADGIKLNNV